jgi:tetratricopeptide (TPR) repeat protein
MQAISYGQSAAQVGPSLPPRIRATALYNQAMGEALLGDRTNCEGHLELAIELTEQINSDESDPAARHQTAEYLEIQRALCYLRLGERKKAITVLEKSVQKVELRQEHRRDRGVYLAHLANACAMEADPDRAIQWGREAVGIYEITASNRIGMPLDQLERRLDEWRQRPDASELVKRIHSARGTA